MIVDLFTKKRQCKHVLKCHKNSCLSQNFTDHFVTFCHRILKMSYVTEFQASFVTESHHVTGNHISDVANPDQIMVGPVVKRQTNLVPFSGCSRKHYLSLHQVVQSSPQNMS